MRLQLPRSAVHGVRFGALQQLVSPSPGLQLEVADLARPAAA
jgi:hypothetical protein